MKIIQKPISAEHNSAMFFDGIIATKAGLELRTFNDGEITYEGQPVIGEQIIAMGEANLINDNDIEDERNSCVSILVDKFIAIAEVPASDEDGIFDEELIFDNYDEAIKAFIEI